MKKLLIVFTVVITAFTSCTKDALPTVTVENFVVTIAENPTLNQSVGKINATISDANNIGYELMTPQDDIATRIALNRNTGEVTITDPLYFDYELRHSASTTAKVDVFNASNDMATATYSITINITDVVEIVQTKPEVLSTNTVSYTSNSAIISGSITSDGHSDIIERGIVWSLTSNEPTLADTKVVASGTGIGNFTVTMTGLTSNTTYSVRSYATNGIGTSYGWLAVFTTSLGVGATYQGGVIAYIFQSGDPGYVAGQVHGLIATPSDQGSAIQWYNGSNTTTGATGTALGTGNANTNAIVTSQGAGSYAAKVCSDLVLGGFVDWYLPSKDELNKLCLNGFDIGSFTSGNYWSSSEGGSDYAWNQSSSGGSASLTSKGNLYHVRAVRTF